MIGRLNANQRKTIVSFIHSGAKEYQLLYSFAADGANSATFHQKCDNKGPTVTVIYNSKGSIYGGYTERSWTSDSGTYQTDPHAFLFRLQKNQKDALSKFPVKNQNQAIICNVNNGPIFGRNDILTFTDSLVKSGDEYTMNGSFSIGTTYDTGGITATELTDDVRTVWDLEVYSVKDLPQTKIWRKCSGWNSEILHELKYELENYSPPKMIDIETANILIVGPIGAGKSSFFNTSASVFRGNISDEAVCGSAGQSITSKFRKYKIRKSMASKPLNFCLCDTRGLEESCGIDGQELNFILDGNVTDGYEFNTTKQISSDTLGFVSNPSLGQKMHCVCFILDGTNALVISEKMMEKLKSLQNKVRQKEIPHLFVLTKIDKVCSHVEENVCNVFSSNAVKDLVEGVAGRFGVSRNQVLPMKNYEVEVDVDQSIDILTLITLKRLLSSADNYFSRFLDDNRLSVTGTKKGLKTSLGTMGLSKEDVVYESGAVKFFKPADVVKTTSYMK